jgi:hypothetical protein
MQRVFAPVRDLGVDRLHAPLIAGALS